MAYAHIAIKYILLSGSKFQCIGHCHFNIQEHTTQKKSSLHISARKKVLETVSEFIFASFNLYLCVSIYIWIVNTATACNCFDCIYCSFYCSNLHFWYFIVGSWGYLKCSGVVIKMTPVSQALFCCTCPRRCYRRQCFGGSSSGLSFLNHCNFAKSSFGVCMV